MEDENGRVREVLIPEVEAMAAEIAAGVPRRGLSRAMHNSPLLKTVARYLIYGESVGETAELVGVSPSFVQKLYSHYEAVAKDRIESVREKHYSALYDNRLAVMNRRIDRRIANGRAQLRGDD